jgi:hypothetical protein
MEIDNDSKKGGIFDWTKTKSSLYRMYLMWSGNTRRHLAEDRSLVTCSEKLKSKIGYLILEQYVICQSLRLSAYGTTGVAAILLSMQCILLPQEHLSRLLRCPNWSPK